MMNQCPGCGETMFEGDCINRDCNAVIVPPEALLKPLPQTARELKLTKALEEVTRLVEGALEDPVAVFDVRTKNKLKKIVTTCTNGLGR